MKILCGLMVVLIFQQAIAKIVRKPPAFSAPVYSNSYLPAAMQVIFHSVEQLKLLQEEEALHDHSTTTSSSTIHSMKHQRPLSTTVSISALPTAATEEAHNENTDTLQLTSTLPATIEVSSNGSSETHDDLTEAAQHVATSIAGVPTTPDDVHEESPEVNEETAEANYATPETNHETPEPVQEFQETNQEVPEENDEEKSSTTGHPSSEVPNEGTSQANVSLQQSTQIPSQQATESDSQKKKEPSVDSVIYEIYGIVKPTMALIEESNTTDETKSAAEMHDSIEKMENVEEEEEDTRFTLLGEKVAQVPRPSLSGYLRRAKVPPRRSLQQLAGLYDALSKDARKQGFARFGGYSDEVLKALQSSAEGGVGPQLKKLLERMIELNELTRDDAKMKTSEALKDLDDPASALNNDLRRILPLRYAA